MAVDAGMANNDLLSASARPPAHLVAPVTAGQIDGQESNDAPIKDSVPLARTPDSTVPAQDTTRKQFTKVSASRP